MATALKPVIGVRWHRLQEVVFPDDVSLRRSSKTSGEIVPAGMQTFEVDVVVKSNQVLTGEEALALTSRTTPVRQQGPPA